MAVCCTWSCAVARAPVRHVLRVCVCVRTHTHTHLLSCGAGSLATPNSAVDGGDRSGSFYASAIRRTVSVSCACVGTPRKIVLLPA
jgi:hypothetical protein